MPYPHGGKYSTDPYYMTAEEEQLVIERELESMCADCPPMGYPTDKARCDECPRRAQKSDKSAMRASTCVQCSDTKVVTDAEGVEWQCAWCSITDYTPDQIRALLWSCIRDRRHPLRSAPYESQSDLAAAIGVSPEHLNGVIHGKKPPTGKVLRFLGIERVVTYRKTFLIQRNNEAVAVDSETVSEKAKS